MHFTRLVELAKRPKEKYSNIDFVDIFIIRHSLSKLSSALIYSNIQVFK